ncbi:hypothetical protein BH10CHL1_BH10CHL1_11210 [soil metagenome]
MMPQLIELVAQERYQALLQEAEQRRLVKLLSPQASMSIPGLQWLRYWLGVHMVVWGLKLQGISLGAAPQLPEHKPYNS